MGGGDVPATASDLAEAEEIAERGHMRLHEADAHLDWARLHHARNDGQVPAIAGANVG